MESMVSKTFLKVIGFAGSAFLTIFAGIFGLLAVCCLFVAIVDADFLSAILTAFAGFIAWVLWSIRKDALL